MRLAPLWYGALQLSGLTAAVRWLSSRSLILCYHNVEPDTADSSDRLGLHMRLTAFVRQIDWIARNYRVVPLAEIVSRVIHQQSLRGLAAVTFDDGYCGVFEYAWPVLRDRGLPATVFLVAEAPDGTQAFWWENATVLRAFSAYRLETWLTAQRGDGAAIVATLADPSRPAQPARPHRQPATWDTIRDAVRTGLQLGAHSVTHRSLTTLEDGELQSEIVASRDLIKERTGVTPEFFAYPYGLWNERVRRAVCAAGYRAAFTLAHGLRARARDPWSLPRLNVPALIADPAFHAWAAGLMPPLGRRA